MRTPLQQLETVFQAFTDLIFVLDPDGLILDYKSSDSLLPFSFPGTTLDQKIKDVFPAEVAGRLEEALRMVQQTGEVISLEYALPLSDREYWFEARLAPFSQSQVLMTARDITRCRENESRMRRQMEQLSALRSIDLAIASGLDLNLLLSMLVERVTVLMNVDAAAILLLNPRTNLLEFASGKGFRSNILQYTRLKLGEGCAGQVAVERKMLNIPDLRKNMAEFNRSPLFLKEDFIVYYGMPLMAKGRVLGVLEIFHRSPLDPDVDWLSFLGIMSGQAAIAIDSAVMFNDLQRSNLELNLAYDATIEGLSHALDLRDKETKEHTLRVTNITVQLAARFGIGEADLVHIRRGAILHDIGKVALPDQILFKPGPLLEEEWKVMRRHPEIAVELLSPVGYLTPALKIPHWHHEKWDGSGYPDGLQGEQIPFPARLFALADVYDALISNRPYRSAWSRQDAVRYIESQSGTHFDPRLVPEFLRLVNETTFHTVSQSRMAGIS
ncbi:MAG TPA: HD domain-containing phosphohydrolase [Anaerolineales bacterium]|nr:HD domain-containing phosphohydrolase [Anaerolineales bacterium]